MTEAKQGRVIKLNPDQLRTIVEEWIGKYEGEVVDTWFVMEDGRFEGVRVLVKEKKGDGDEQ